MTDSPSILPRLAGAAGAGLRLLDAWAAYEAAQVAAEAGGWEFGLSMAAANAYAAYDRLTMRIVSNLRIDRI